MAAKKQFGDASAAFYREFGAAMAAEGQNIDFSPPFSGCEDVERRPEEGGSTEMMASGEALRNNSEIVLENPSTSKENKTVMENHIVLKNSGGIVQQSEKDEPTRIESIGVLSDGEKINETGLGNQRISEITEDTFSRFANNQGDESLYMEPLVGGNSRDLDKSEDVDVDIMGHMDHSPSDQFDADAYDSAESESSFGESVSDYEHDYTPSKEEIDARFFKTITLTPEFGGFGDISGLRKRKLTDDWNTFVHPIKWRCLWIKQVLKKLNSQEYRLKRVLEQYNKRELFELENDTVENVGAKSLAFSSGAQRLEVMERKKRKRVEDTTDITSHLSQHAIFSYFENKKSASNGKSINANRSKPVILTDTSNHQNDVFVVNDEPLNLRSDEDNILEQYLWKLHLLEKRICKLRDKYEKVANLLRNFAPCNGLPASQDQVGPSYKNTEEDEVEEDANLIQEDEVEEDANLIQEDDKPLRNSVTRTHNTRKRSRKRSEMQNQVCGKRQKTLRLAS